MRQTFQILYEGLHQAWQQLIANKLRSFLSLLGISIGILCIIGVKSAVDSLEDNIRGSMAKLGNDVIYIEKFSWSEDPGNNFWKWMKRPSATYDEYLKLKDKLHSAEKVAFWMGLGAKTIKWQSSSVENCWVLAATEESSELFHLEFRGEGRFLTPGEYASGAEVCIMGYTIAKGLFGEFIDPLGKEVAVSGRKLRIVGVLAESGKDLLKPFNFDNCILIGMNLGRRAYNIRPRGMWSRTSMMVQAKPGVSIDEMKDELVGALRSVRSLKPREEDNFALNTLSVLSKLFDSVFTVLNMAGFFIGIFALLVGMFSVANIMFVSVKERTNIIGIKMALGAKRWFILLEILVESILLCLVGGIMGLIMIFGAAKLATYLYEFDLHLSLSNVLIGLATSSVVGILSGLIPAIQASGMDPVEAIRK